MLKSSLLVPVWVLVFIFTDLAAQPQVPQLMNYQGLLTDSTGNPLPDSIYNVTFRIHNDSINGITLWVENRDVRTRSGAFEVVLGEVSPLQLYSTFYDSIKYLGVTVEPFSEMTPRSRFVTAPYAQNANRVTTIDGSIGGQVSGNIEITPGTDPDGKIEIQGTNFIGLYTAMTGNSSAILPLNSISSLEQLNEPGLASIQWTGVPFELTTSMTDLCSLSVTIPETGYILILGATRIDAGNSGTGNLVYVQIDETQGGSFDYGNLVFQAGGFTTQVGSVSPQRVYFKGAGTYTFRLEAMKGSASSICYCSTPSLTAIYFPTAYGFVGTTQ